MFGIPGYDPDPATSVQEVIGTHGDRCNALQGRRLHRATGLHFISTGDWMCTRPLVLDFDGRCLEIAVAGFDQMYLSWDAIDIEAPIDDEDQQEPDFALAWGQTRAPELQALTESPLADVRILETDFSLRSPEGITLRSWLLNGLEFVTADGRAVQMFNGLDELKLSAKDPSDDTWRRRAIPR
jgi:hypothetical protein